jgi:hypothetical protein
MKISKKPQRAKKATGAAGRNKPSKPTPTKSSTVAHTTTSSSAHSQDDVPKPPNKGNIESFFRPRVPDVQTKTVTSMESIPVEIPSEPTSFRPVPAGDPLEILFGMMTPPFPASPLKSFSRAPIHQTSAVKSPTPRQAIELVDQRQCCPEPIMSCETDELVSTPPRYPNTHNMLDDLQFEMDFEDEDGTGPVSSMAKTCSSSKPLDFGSWDEPDQMDE